MTIIQTAAWPNAERQSRKARWPDVAMGLAAMAAVIATTAQGIMEQAQAEREDAAAAAQSGSADELARLALPTRETMIAGYAGAPYTYDSDVHLKKDAGLDFTVKDVSWDAEPFKSPIYYGARVVRWFDGGRRGAMIDFTHSKTLAALDDEKSLFGKIEDAPVPARSVLKEVYRKLEFSHGHNMLTLNGLWRLADLAPRLSPYVGAGVGVNLPHSEIQLKAVRGRTYEYQYTGPVVQAVIGIEFRVPRMSYFLEYKFSLASYDVPLSQRDGSVLFVDLWNQLTSWMAGEAPGGRLSTRLTSHQVIGGLGMRFGGPPAVAP